MASHPFKRSVRLGNLLQREISQVIRQEVSDPRLGMITITGVHLSDNLKDATVFFSVKDEQKAITVKGLLRATKFIRARIGHRCYLKYVPRIRFEFDAVFSRAIRIESLLHAIDADEEGRKTESSAGELFAAPEEII